MNGRRRLAAPLVMTFVAGCSYETSSGPSTIPRNPPCFVGLCPDTSPVDASRFEAGPDADATIETGDLEDAPDAVEDAPSDTAEQ
jgi:hypothetical protein